MLQVLGYTYELKTSQHLSILLVKKDEHKFTITSHIMLRWVVADTVRVDEQHI